MNKTITLTRKTRKLGFGYSLDTTNYPKMAVNKPDYAGTAKQILQAIEDNWIMRNHTNCYMATALFYGGKKLETCGDRPIEILQQIVDEGKRTLRIKA